MARRVIAPAFQLCRSGCKCAFSYKRNKLDDHSLVPCLYREPAFMGPVYGLEQRGTQNGRPEMHWQICVGLQKWNSRGAENPCGEALSSREKSRRRLGLEEQGLAELVAVYITGPESPPFTHPTQGPAMMAVLGMSGHGGERTVINH